MPQSQSQKKETSPKCLLIFSWWMLCHLEVLSQRLPRTYSKNGTEYPQCKYKFSNAKAVTCPIYPGPHTAKLGTEQVQIGAKVIMA